MQVLNRTYRGVDKTTDVLSFPQTDVGTQHPALSTQHFVLGDIVINLHKTERQALEYRHSFYEELNRLLIHGLLHLIGYDHEAGRYAERKMEKKNRELLSKI